VEDPAVTKAVERFFVRGGALAGIEKT
jgi:hypothetical protein